jgi:KDO2-lipid IV(A) lauroyltransferase
MRLLGLLSYPIGQLYWHLAGNKRRSTQKNLAACYPDMPAGQRDRLGRNSTRCYIMNALEAGVCWYWPERDILSLFDEPSGMGHLENVRASGQGVVLLIPHFGNWELMNHGLNQLIDVVALYKPGRMADVNATLVKKRRRFGAEMVPASRSGLKLILERLGSSKMVQILPDQEPSAGEGCYVPLFGVAALTGVLASRLIQRTACKALFAVCRRTGRGRHQIQFLPVDEEIYSDDLEISVAALNRGVEDCIAIDPTQYLWAYKRFRTRPPGEPEFY